MNTVGIFVNWKKYRLVMAVIVYKMYNFKIINLSCGLFQYVLFYN